MDRNPLRADSVRRAVGPTALCAAFHKLVTLLVWLQNAYSSLRRDHLKLLLFCATIIWGAFTPGVSSQTMRVSAATDSIVARIASYEQLGHGYGEGTGQLDQVEDFQGLYRTATLEELTWLTDHHSPIVRVVSFRVLCQRTGDCQLPIVLKHIADTGRFRESWICQSEQHFVGDYLIDLITPEWTDPTLPKLDSVQQKTLDSHMIVTPNRLGALTKAQERSKSDQSLYSRVRELALMKNCDALVALARFQKPEDRALILDFPSAPAAHRKIKARYKAISEFPDPQFWQYLMDQFANNLQAGSAADYWSDLLTAIAAYRNEQASNAFQIALDQAGSTKNDSLLLMQLCNAVGSRPCTAFTGLYWRLWEDHQQITPALYVFLKQIDRKRALQDAKTSVERSAQSGIPVRHLVDYCFDILAVDRPWIVSYLKQELLNAGPGNFEALNVVALRLKDSSLIDPLLSRVELEDNPWLFMCACETLLGYDDTYVTRALRAHARKNRVLEEPFAQLYLEFLLAKKFGR